ncbi:MAG TPA: cyclodeaminase/cyclohydrolase family protein [Candidatus Limnocylindria bacterium]|nr:cyclodeaminase/cyclohydrolase family protein [Candidatus Limnocylindria bacterium]
METRLRELTVRELLARLATDDPVPGGGSASALAGATGAALVGMVVALTTGRPAAEGHEEELAELAARSARLSDRLQELAERDAQAYGAVIAARRLPRDSDDERNARAARIDEATREATLVPLETARTAAEVLALAERLAPIGSRNAVSDVGVAALLAVAALRGAAMNVRINIPYLRDDEPLGEEAARELARLLDGLDERERAIRDAVEQRIG